MSGNELSTALWATSTTIFVPRGSCTKGDTPSAIPPFQDHANDKDEFVGSTEPPPVNWICAPLALVASTVLSGPALAVGVIYNG